MRLALKELVWLALCQAAGFALSLSAAAAVYALAKRKSWSADTRNRAMLLCG
jgi:hypothetical protein